MRHWNEWTPFEQMFVGMAFGCLAAAIVFGALTLWVLDWLSARHDRQGGRE